MSILINVHIEVICNGSTGVHNVLLADDLDDAAQKAVRG
jgi:fructose-specific phosphotransferase system component IIB